jgi:mannose-6-phosphate isomerase-like protein (cupin superfamily)
MTDELVVDPVGRQRYVFRRVTEEDGTEVQHAEGWVDPGGNVPPHVHPHQEERFDVLEGEMTFTVGRGKKRARAGESVVVPPGTRHAFRSTGDVPAHIRVEARPAADLEEFLRRTAELGRSGYLVKIGPFSLPKTPRGVVEAAKLLHRHRDNTVILFPPPTVQRLLMDPLARRAARR